MIEELKKEFEGVGEMKGFSFQQISKTDEGYIYKVEQEENVNYEVFKKTTVPICIDFEKRIWSETDFKDKYPKAKDFGKWAFCVKTLEKAKEILAGFN